MTDEGATASDSSARADRALAVALLVSLAGWTVYLLNQPRAHNLGDLSRGAFSDHISHANAARALLFGGVNLWSQPVGEALPRLPPDVAAQLPADIRPACLPATTECRGLGHGDPSKPVLCAWSHLPRPYPPGSLLAVLPVALLYQWTPMGFTAASHALVWLFVLYAHVALFFFLRAARTAGPALAVAGIIFAFEVIRWALEGFYDAVAVIPLSLMAVAVARKQWLPALLAFSAAAFLHYRAYFFGPWAVVLAWRLVRSGEWRAWTRRDWAMVGGVVALSAASLVSFAVVAPFVSRFPLDNPVSAATWAWGARVGFVAVIACAVGLLAWSRSWLDAFLCVWITVMVVNLRQAFPWHPVLMFPWLLLRQPLPIPARQPVADTAKLLVVLFLAMRAFRSPLVPDWLALLP